MSAVTDDYSDASLCLEKSRAIWEEYCDNLKTDPNKAKAMIITRMQIAMRDAYQSGKSVGIYEADKLGV